MQKDTNEFTVELVRNSYDQSKANDEKLGEWAAHYLYRPISFYITPFFLKRDISATNVTLIALVLVFLLPVMATWFPLSYMFVGLLATIICILDCVDGNIARVSNSGSKLGHYLDFITDIVHRIVLYFSIGLLIDLSDMTPDFILGNGVTWLFIAAMLAIVARMSRVYADATFDFQMTNESQVEIETKENSVQDKLFIFISGLDWLLPLILIASGFLGILHWILIWLVLYSLADFLYSQYAIIQKLISRTAI